MPGDVNDLCLSEETLNTVGSLYLVYMPGDVNDLCLSEETLNTVGSLYLVYMPGDVNDLCLSEETLNTVGSLYLVYMPGDVNDPTRDKWVATRGLTNSKTGPNTFAKRITEEELIGLASDINSRPSAALAKPRLSFVMSVLRLVSSAFFLL